MSETITKTRKKKVVIDLGNGLAISNIGDAKYLTKDGEKIHINELEGEDYGKFGKGFFRKKAGLIIFAHSNGQVLDVYSKIIVWSNAYFFFGQSQKDGKWYLKNTVATKIGKTKEQLAGFKVAELKDDRVYYGNDKNNLKKLEVLDFVGQ